MKFALITADKVHKKSFVMNPECDDATGFLQWIAIWGGVHLSFEALREEDKSYLKDFDVVMMSGHPNHIQDIIDIGRMLKDSDTITMFYPEGSTQLYDNSINGYHPEYYEAWRACDIFSMAEEDKQEYYERFVGPETLVRFIHVPISMEMASSVFFTPRHFKAKKTTLVYCDNNPNHPMIALGCANRLGLETLILQAHGKEISRIFPDLKIKFFDKLGQFPYLRLLRQTFLHMYPTEWIGTARQQISCAAVGTPCIGNRDSHTQQRLFPRLAVNIYNVSEIERLAKELMQSETFYNEVADYAFANLGFYDMGNTIRRFANAIDEAHRMKKVSVPV